MLPLRVLILVVVEYGLEVSITTILLKRVLILVVVEYGLEALSLAKVGNIFKS